jgi:hypothetical protein
MTTPSETAVLVAAGLVRGPFTVAAVTRRLRAMRGRNTRGLLELARLLAAEFGSGARPREREVAAFLEASSVFAKAFARAGHLLERLPPPRMLSAEGAPAGWPVPPIATLAALADWLGVDLDDLQAMRGRRWRDQAVPRARHQHYHRQWIARRHGLPRLIEAPKARLKVAQRRILAGILAHIPPHPVAHGFRPGRNTVSFVTPHAGRRCVLRMDVADFFASFGRGRVLRVFLNAGYPEAVAAALADVCTTTTPRAVCLQGLGDPPAMAERLRMKLLRPHLPQGAPTSPALANLCAFAMDARLAGLARRFGATYTRYADDLLFSGDAAFGRDAARCEVYAAAVLLGCGLEAAHCKTRIMRSGVSQRAAGLVMNAHPAVPRRARERLEAILWNCVRRGPQGENRSGHPDFRAHLRGCIAQVSQVHAALGARLLTLFEGIAWVTPRA